MVSLGVSPMNSRTLKELRPLHKIKLIKTQSSWERIHGKLSQKNTNLFKIDSMSSSPTLSMRVLSQMMHMYAKVLIQLFLSLNSRAKYKMSLLLVELDFAKKLLRITNADKYISLELVNISYLIYNHLILSSLDTC